MNLDEYQKAAGRTEAAIPQRELMIKNAIGLCGEAGETVELIKKHLFHGHPLDKEKLKKEIGDVLWYVAQLAAAAEISLEDVGQANVAKLKARYPEGFTPEASLNRPPE